MSKCKGKSGYLSCSPGIQDGGGQEQEFAAGAWVLKQGSLCQQKPDELRGEGLQGKGGLNNKRKQLECFESLLNHLFAQTTF